MRPRPGRGRASRAPWRARSLGPGCLGRLEVRVDDREEPLDLVDLEDARQAPRQSRRRDRAPRVAGRQPLAGRAAVEGADRGEPLGDGRTGAPRCRAGRGRRAGRPRAGGASRRRARRASRGRHRPRWRRPGSCARRRRARPETGGTGRERGGSAGSPRGRVHALGGRLCGTRRAGRGAATGARAAAGDDPCAHLRRPRAGRASASGSGGPPA